MGLKGYAFRADTAGYSTNVIPVTTIQEFGVRKLVIILVLLSAFAMTRNVLVVSAVSSAGPSADMTAAVEDGAPQFLLSGSSGDGVPEAPGTLSLFVAGLAGLMAAGGRRADRQRATA